MDLEIDGNVALVTASSSGLGKASATALAANGVDVVLNGRDPDRLEAAAEDVRSVASGRVVTQPGDITDPDAITDLVDRTIDEFGRLDHLVTSAGGPPSGRFLDISEEEWYEAYDLLVMSVVRLVHAAEPHLKADGGGTIVTITSKSVKEAIDALVLSNAVRMSVIGLEKTLSKELAPEIRVNAVLPGSIETARIEELKQDAVDRGEYDTYDEAIDAASEAIPLGRLGEPNELGDVVAFLSSPRSGFVSGAAVPIDGGSGASNL